MKISDEMRKWADDMSKPNLSMCNPPLRALANRIDSEMAELPKDANGEPIHAGSELFEPDGTRWKVLRIEYSSYGVDIVATSGRAELVIEPQDYRTMAHEYQDSWERIADELDAWCDKVDVDEGACGKPRAIADRIRRLAEKEGQQ